MQRVSRFLMTAAMCAVIAGAGLCLTGGSAAADNVDKIRAVCLPSLEMKHWAKSSHDEKAAFLLGFATMLELEKEWQGAKPLPITQSTVGSWLKGLDGVTIGQMIGSLDRYAKNNPNGLDVSVLEALGTIYVRPKLSSTELDRVARKVDQITR